MVTSVSVNSSSPLCPHDRRSRAAAPPSTDGSFDLRSEIDLGARLLIHQPSHQAVHAVIVELIDSAVPNKWCQLRCQRSRWSLGREPRSQMAAGPLVLTRLASLYATAPSQFILHLHRLYTAEWVHLTLDSSAAAST